MACADCSHEEKFHFLLGDLINMEGNIILSDVDESNFCHRKCRDCGIFGVFFYFKKLFPPALIRRTYVGMCSVEERGSDT